MVEFPPEEEQRICAVCLEQFEKYDPDWATNYANLVCRRCDEKVVTEDGEEPTVGPHTDQGDHLVYIDGIKCWRRIRFGTFFTRRDEHDCDTLEGFVRKHRDAVNR